MSYRMLLSRLRFFTVFLAFSSFAVCAKAQTIPLGNDVSRPIPGAGHDYIHLLNETVNPANGSLNITIGLPAPKGRGLSLPYSLIYNSGSVHHFLSAAPGVGQYEPSWVTTLTSGGWGNTLPYATAAFWNVGVASPARNGGSCTVSNSYTFYDPSGGAHALGLSNVSYFNGSSGGPVSDTYCNTVAPNSISGGDPQVKAQTFGICNGIPNQGQPNPEGCSTANPAFTVTDKDGTVYSFPFDNISYDPGIGNVAAIAFKYPSSIEDRNGNVITVSNTPGTYTTPVFTNTLGGTVVSSTPGSGNSTVLTVGGVSYTIASTTSTANYTAPSLRVTTPPSNQISCSPNFTIPNSSGGYGSIPDSGVSNVVQTITLPNQTQYTFHYDDTTFGLVTEIDYPSGGWVKYTWKFNDTLSDFVSFAGTDGNGGSSNGACNFEYKTPVIGTRTVGYDTSSTSVTTQIQTFTYSTAWNSTNYGVWDSKTTTVSTLDNITGKTVKTIYTYGGVSAGSQDSSEIPVETQVQYYDWNSTTAPLKTLNKTWFTPYEMTSEQTVLNGVVSSTKAYCYAAPTDSIAEVDEYDYGVAPPTLSQGPSNYAQQAPTCGQLTPSRKTVYTYQNFTGAPITPVLAGDPTIPQNPSGAYSFSGEILDRPCQIISYDSSSQRASESDFFYDGGSVLCGSAGSPSVVGRTVVPGTHDETLFGPTSSTPRGNVTTFLRWSNLGASPTTTYTYDETGQVATMTDPCGNSNCAGMSGSGHTTTFDYTDSPVNGNTFGNSNAYLTTVTRPATNGVNHIEQYLYDYSTGNLTFHTDENSLVTSYTYADPLNRITNISGPPDPEYYNLQAQTNYKYNDSAPSPTVTVTTAATPDPDIVDVAVMDGFARVVQTQHSDPDGTDLIDTTYDGFGRLFTVSNPYRGSLPDAITSFTYDGLGRKTKQGQPDGSYLQWNYSGNLTDFFDETGVQWQRRSDSFGNLTRVMELGTSGNALSLETDYGYNSLNNLTSVSQLGIASETPRTRGFTYDSLSRLITATNPEAGSICYGQWSGNNCINGYDANGNLAYKTDARNITISYQHDALNRLTQKSYSNGDPTAQFVYDVLSWPGQPACHTSWVSQCNIVGRLSYEQTVDPVTGAVQTFDSFSYDPDGRFWLKFQGTSPNCVSCYSTLYRYDLAGHIMQYRKGTYGAGIAPQLFLGDNVFTYDSAGRIQSIAESTNPNDPPSAQTLLFTANQYGPMGLTQATLGNGMTLSIGYNKQRGWLNSIAYTLSTTNPAYNLGLNFYPNGNVQTATDSINGTWSYTYDALNRLHTASSSSQAFRYDFDSFGNRTGQTVTAGSGPQPTYTFNNNRNQIDPGAGVVYDPQGGGNVTSDGFHSYTYDAEGRLSGVDGSISYIYNAEGQRTAVLSGGAVLRQYLYDNVGRPATVLDGNGNLIRAEIWAGAMHLGDDTPDGTNNYILSDHLGNLRAMYDSAGNQVETRQSLPFGEEQNATGTDVDPLHFTGKERDSESGLDDFGARYYASTMGRFMSPDSTAYSGLKNPQSWNLYAYTLNNPLRYIDPTGHTVECKTSAADCLAAAQGAVGKDAAGQLSTKTTQSFWQKIFGGSTTTLQINGNEADFRGASGNASKLADLIDSKTNFEVSIQHTGDPEYSSVISSIVGGGAKFDLQGGAITYMPSQGYEPAVFLDPRSAATVDTDAARDHIPPANLAEKFAHELLGHEWGEVFGGHPAGTAANKQDAINSENEVRRTDPSQGQKTKHHD